MKRQRISLLLFAALVATALLPACSPKVYTLNLSPASQVGWKFSLTSDMVEKSQSHSVINFPGATSPQSDDRDEEFTGRLEGEGEVLAVYANGGIQKLSLTVKVLHASRAGKAVPNLPAAGAKIVVGRQGDRIAISVDDKPAEQAVADALNELVILDDEKSTVQELFGPKTPVKVGATWPVDSAAVENALKGGLGGKSNSAKGEMQFASAQGETATLIGDFTLDYKPGLPRTMTLDSGEIKGAMTWTVPTTAAKGDVKFSRDLLMKITAHGNPNDTSLKLTVTGEQKISMEMIFR